MFKYSGINPNKTVYFRSNETVGGEDEKDCPAPGQCDRTFQHMCADQQCIHKRKICDVKSDCADGGEEQSCSKYGFMSCSSLIQPLYSKYYFNKDNTKCFTDMPTSYFSSHLISLSAHTKLYI